MYMIKFSRPDVSMGDDQIVFATKEKASIWLLATTRADVYEEEEEKGLQMTIVEAPEGSLLTARVIILEDHRIIAVPVGAPILDPRANDFTGENWDYVE